MSAAEETSTTGNENEEKMSEDNDSGNMETEKERSNQELDIIMENITPTVSGDEISALIGDGKENSGDRPDENKKIAKDNATETPSPNDGSDSQDEDLLLRWDDDDDFADEQDKINDLVLKEIEVLGDDISNDITDISCAYEDQSDKKSIAAKVGNIEANVLISNKTNNENIAVKLESVDDNQEILNSSTTNVPTKVTIKDVEANNANVITDSQDSIHTPKVVDKADDFVSSYEETVGISPSDSTIQNNDHDDVAECTISHDTVKDEINVTEGISSTIIEDNNRRNATSIPERDHSTSSIIDENIIIQDINDKINKALEINNDSAQEKVSLEKKQDDAPSVSKADEINVPIIDEKKLIENINDKINTALIEVNKPECRDNDTEQKEITCDENIRLLEQELKVMAQSINPNLDTHIDVVCDINNDLEDAITSVSEIVQTVESPIFDNDVEKTRVKMDVDEKIEDITLIDKNQHSIKSEIVVSNDSVSITDQTMDIDVNIDTKQNQSEMVENMDSSVIKENIEKETGVEMGRGIKILNVDQINQNINKIEPEVVQNIKPCIDKENVDNDPHIEMDTDTNIKSDQIEKDPDPIKSEVLQNTDPIIDKETSSAKNCNVNVDPKPQNTKEKETEVENVCIPNSNNPEKNVNESDEDDDVVEIIERCPDYIDLSSQSPINLDNENDPVTTNENDPKTSTEDVTNNKDNTESQSDITNSGKDHRLKPDVMLEIPMHNLIDVDDIEESINIDSEETSQDSVTKVSEAKITQAPANKDVQEETASTVEKVKNVDVEKPQNKSQDVLEETKKETDNLSMQIGNEPQPAKDVTDIKAEADSNKIETAPNDSNKIIDTKKETNKEKIIDLDDYETPSDKQNDVKLEDAKPDTSTEVAKENQASGFAMTMTPDTADEAPEVSDSLGLLAESSRVRREDEDIEEEDYDDDFDQDDESSNQMTAEHSEDSNAQHSEPDSKDQEDKTGDKEHVFNFEENDNVELADVADDVVVEDTVISNVMGSVVEKTDKDINKETTVVEKTDELTKEGETDLPPTDVETVKLSDNSDNETESVSGKDAVTSKDKKNEKSSDKTTKTSSKTKKLGIATPRTVLNIVDLEESSSSEDDPQEVQVSEQPELEKPADVTSVNIPTGIEIMSAACGSPSQILTKEGEVVIQGVPKPPPHKPARLNTSEVTIKTAHATTESTLVIPETKMTDTTSSKPKIGLEIFNLDSDDDDIGGSGKACGGASKLSALELDAALRSGRCLRRGCSAGARGQGAAPLGHYCEDCAHAHNLRTLNLVEGIKNMTPLLELNMEKLSQDLVEISDSDSDNEAQEPKETIGEKGATLLEENLANMINSMWRKYKMDASLQDAKELLDAEMERLDNESKEINKMLNDCQTATDKLRNELYSTFEQERHELPAISIYNTGEGVYVSCETQRSTESSEIRHGKRRLSVNSVHSAKRAAIPLGYAPLDTDAVPQDQDPTSMLMAGSNRYEEDKDVSVVQLSAESAPADLPPPGEPKRPPLRVGMQVYAMRNAFGSWSRARIIEAVKSSTPSPPFPSFRVKFDHKVKNPCKVLSARCLAYIDPADVRLTIGTRVIALFKEPNNQSKTESYYSGIVAEIPNPVNNYRYLVFFDDGYAQYALHVHTRVVCASAAPVWEEVHPFSREFVRNYLCAYPERPMVRLHAGQKLNTEWNGKWWDSRVIKVDASLVQVHFEEDNRTEWIYRGSTRLEPLFLELQAAVRHRGRHLHLPRSKAQLRSNMPYVEYTRSYEQDKSTDAQQEELRRQRSVAKKSTANSLPISAAPEGADAFASRVVYYTPRNAVRPHKMVAHTCGPKCKRTDVLSLKELRSYNPLAKPLLSGWERQLVRNKGVQAVLYRAPCGRRVRSPRELHRYLRTTRSDAPVDLFDFNPDTHCLAEFVLSRCIVGKKDLSHGKENVPVPCVNSVDESLPEFCSYNTERTPTAGVPLNLDPEFLCGCDCTDDCEDKSKCACWQLTLEGARTIGMDVDNVGYVYKRLPEPLPSGIYECNVRCKCKATCLNRVAQHPLQLKLQVFKTPNRGWGIRALNDVPKGAFLCVYAGNLLTDATANLDGLNEGDEYLAELDYIEVVEQMKEGYEDDVPEADKILDKKETEQKDEKSSSEEESASEEEETVSKDEEMDDDFRPGYIGLGVMEFNKRLRKRGKKKGQEEEESKEPVKKEDKDPQKEQNPNEDCITISDDEEVREPSRFTAQAGMGPNEYVPKYRSVRAHFGRDEACYIMDAKVQGNIGRYLNHSCSPNVFVQNVFVDTHDPRFPWVAFFALSHIRAGTELTWNYNYDVGSVPGKVLYCFCGAPNCRRRLL